MEVASVRSGWEERRLLYGVNRRFTRWFESPRLSTASISSNERAPSATPSDCSDLPSAGQRPVSLVSTLSSGSGSSRDDSLAPLLSGTSNSAPSGDDIDLDLSPPEGAGTQTQTRQDTGVPAGKGCGLQSGRLLQRNNNNTSAPKRTSFLRQTSASPFAAKTMAPNPQLSYLDRVVMEIIETERMYVRDLRMIVEDYLAHIIDQAELSIRPEQVCALFGNIEDIYEFNSELLQSLDLCDNDPVAIARCFVMKSEYFDIYTQYCTNYPNSVAALTECMRNKSLAKLFRERQASLKRSLPLGSYLLKPVQRILKYHLLLQEIAKHFDPEEEGYEVVEEAIYTMTGVAWYINDMKRKHEHAVRLQEVQSLLLNWKGPDLTTYGELVLEGTFKVHRAKNERTLFLFERMLLITKRRGEHYVYKTHISCTTLMLIESAKDALCFSVTHYKHPKQPHTVQARTVEERKLWAHHIKRIILENHHAIIPQKAKEAILEMDSIYSSKYRYSPERMKKPLSCQAEEFPREGRQGRRRSEPTKQVLKHSKGILKHADSEGALPGEARPLQPAASVSTLGSSLGESEAERPSMEEEEEEEEGLSGRKESLEQLSSSDNEEGGPERPLSQPAGRSPGEESDSEEMVMEDDQVADFASSMLAAISCWHYRARALLSMGVTTDEEPGSITEEKSSNRENGQLLVQEEPAPTDTLLQEKTPESEPTQTTEPEPTSGPESHPATPPQGSVSPHVAEAPAPEGETTEKPTPTTPESDSKTLSSGESSEEEEDEKEAAEKQSEANSILPSSVLDKASAIAQHFTNSTRRGSLAMDDACSADCPSPRLPSRTGSTLTLSAEPKEKPVRLNSFCSEPQENFSVTDLTMLSPREDSLFDSGRGGVWRRDSTLSKQDRLLIGKIKSYYETAENQDATFSLRRRESLTYIPSGLVRSSVSRLNSIPKDRDSAEEKNSSALTTSSTPDPSTTETDLASAAETQGHMSSSASVDSLESSQKSHDPEDSAATVGSHSSANRSERMQEKPVEDEDFRPSSEMIKIWQAMERQINMSQGEERGRQKSRQALRNSTAPNLGLSNRSLTPNKNSDKDGGESDLCTIAEEYTSPSPIKHKSNGVNRTGSLKDALKLWGDEGTVLRAPVPRVAQLRAEAEGEPTSEEQDSLDDADKMKSKVLHLARQYSQRIKTPKLVVWQPSQDVVFAKRTLPCVVEEKESSGKPNLTLPLSSSDQVTTMQLSPIEQVRSPSPPYTSGSVGSPRVLSPSRAPSKSPLNSPPSEDFNWPDVRELRSKYVHSDTSQAPLVPVGRSLSVPERMLDAGLKRRSSCSPNLLLPGGDLVEVPPHRPPVSRDAGLQESSTRPHRASSLDHRLSRLHLSELQKLQDKQSNDYQGYYISAEAPLPNDPSRNIVVVEKLPEAGSEPMELAEEPKEGEEEENYVQIRSPTSREKISIMAVIDRCRAYQESEEYKQREEGGAKMEPSLSGGRGKEIDKGTTSSNEQSVNAQKTSLNSGQKTEAGQQNIVKNLREKFQNLS
ncbi:pleckstrin homology domain-containing family G member 3 [Polymixia lowei]